jgi:predicted O-methyltransferase YrrM
VSKLERNWQYAEQFPVESDAQIRARRLSLELGIDPVSRSVAAHLSSIAVLSRAQNICEIGTGVGLSGLSLLSHTPEATLTTLDIEVEHQRHAKILFAEAGIPAARTRLITGDAAQVLPRMNLGTYDLVLIDANPEGLLEYLEHALKIVRLGGTIVIPHALWRGRVPDPAARDTQTSDFRAMLSAVLDSAAILPVLSPVGDGLLTLTRLEKSD